MKKIIMILFAAFIFAACNNNGEGSTDSMDSGTINTDTSMMIQPDTSGRSDTMGGINSVDTTIR